MGPRIQRKYSQQRHSFRHNEITLDRPRLDFSPIILSILSFFIEIFFEPLEHIKSCEMKTQT